MKEKKRLLRAAIAGTEWLGRPTGTSKGDHEPKQLEILLSVGHEEVKQASWWVDSVPQLGLQGPAFFLLCCPQYQFAFKPGSFCGYKMSQTKYKCIALSFNDVHT